ncbi:plakophilin-3a [Girardinichthys multiradiatus]|uniref:plakophilin-3a n=1 Tax=Girardinichthys multiradiatus TaxID=208333 RepID=UPI001FAC1741|nr:plakophilin-3a [Girardinichthys multiradiatus]
MTSDNVFLSTLQPHTASSSYALPSDKQLWKGPAVSNERAKSRRVQEQVKMKLAEKSTLPRQNGAASSSAMSDYGGSSNMKYSTYSPSFSSKSSYMHSGSKTLGSRMSQKTQYSSCSAAPDMIQFQRMSVGGGGGGGFYREDIRTGGFQGSIRQNRVDQDAMSVHSMRNTPAVNSWVIDNSDAGSIVSEQDATFGRRYAQSAINGYSTQMRQGGGTMTYQTQVQTQAPSSAPSTMCRSVSGPMVRGATLRGGGTEIIQQQSSFKGPAHRTINRIANRNRASVGSMYGTQMTSSAGNLYGGGDQVDRGFVMSQLGSGSQGNLSMHRQGTLSRSMSIKSMHSVGRGMDIYGQTDMEDMGHLHGLLDLDMETAIMYLREKDHGLQVLGAAYIQHQCYNESAAKNEVRERNGIGDLIKLFNSSNSEVRRYATGAARNLIYENYKNKMMLIDHDGILQLMLALEENDDELHKNITGILWNLSSKEDLKEKLAKETFPQLIDKILIPAMKRMKEDKEASDEAIDKLTETPSQAEIFCNTTGCLRNLSSGSDKTRQCLREAQGLMESLVNCLTGAIDKGKAEEKGVENTVCILRNLSYQIYKELPPSYQIIQDNNKDPDSVTETIGCFSPNSKKAKKKLEDQKRLVFRDLVKQPKGMAYLWHPSIVNHYHRVLTSCEINATTREAAIGALQNITAGDEPWAASMCSFAVEHVKILPTLMNLLQTDRKKELLSLTGLLRNLSRHTTVTYILDPLVKKLPEDGNWKEPSDEVVLTICGVLNNMVIQSFDHAKDICHNSGLEKLMGIKKTASSSPERLKTSSAAATVLANMYHYKKLHKLFKKKKFTKIDFETIHT